MVEEDTFLRKILTILGVRISQYKLKPYEKYLSYIIIILGFIFIVHWISATFVNILMHGIHNVGRLVYILMPFHFILIWHFLNVQREKIAIISKKLYSDRKRYIRSNKQKYFVELFIMAMVLIPGVICLIVLVSGEQVSGMWSFGYKIPDEILIYIFSSYVAIIYYSCNIFIILVTFS